MDTVRAIDWWLEREGPDGIPVIEIEVGGEVRDLRLDIAMASDEIVRLRRIEMAARELLREQTDRNAQHLEDALASYARLGDKAQGDVG